MRIDVFRACGATMSRTRPVELPSGPILAFAQSPCERKKQDDWLRLFMVPGMMHCSGGPGTDQFNKMAVLERWREAGTAPEQIVAAHIANGQVDMTRPLCPYPPVAVYKGTGTTNDAANFVCKTP
jgi:feruloyl esterase